MDAAGSDHGHGLREAEQNASTLLKELFEGLGYEQVVILPPPAVARPVATP